MSRRIAVIGLALLLAACGTQPTSSAVQPSSTLTALDVASAQAAMAEQLRSLGFLVATEPGLVRAEIPAGAPVEWVTCDRVSVEDEQSIIKRYRWADPETRRIWLEAQFSRVEGGTSVTLSPYYEGVYRDSFTNRTFRERCASSGRLEPLLLAAVGGG